MHLAILKVSGFRRIENLELRFGPGLNVLVGPNNIGKTAVIDALRALLTTSEEGTLRVDEYDLHSSPAGKAAEIRFDYVFRDLSVDEEADFYAALKPVTGAPGKFEAHFHVRYAASAAAGRLRPKRWCGDHEENAITSEMLDELRAVYMPALRDPASGLRPGRMSQLARLIDRLASEHDKSKLVEMVKTFEETLSKEAPFSGTQEAIAERHLSMLGPQLKQLLQIELTPPEFQRLAARLSMSVEALDIEQNGLGYNNLIYMAVVLSEMALNPDAAYRALIVEEPEAHLHPQLQAVLLEHLQSIETPVAGQNAVQVFVTSHSPNFASIAKLDSLVCMGQAAGKATAYSPREEAFAPKKKEKLQRYLDVTRGELFFAKRIIMVEGAAERFLISAMAAKIGINLRQHAVSILSTEGLNFDCFAPLFGEGKIPVRVALLTDADPPATVFPALADPLVWSTAAAAIKTLQNPLVTAFFARKTLEYDLALHPENHPTMLAALKEIHPGIGVELAEQVEAATAGEKAETLFCGMFARAIGTNVKKGAYAQALAEKFGEPGSACTVPEYVSQALAYAIS